MSKNILYFATPITIPWKNAGADPGFQVRGGGGAHLKKLRREEGGANIFGVFRVKNHDFTPKKIIFFPILGGGGGGGAGAPPGSAPGMFLLDKRWSCNNLLIDRFIDDSHL